MIVEVFSCSGGLAEGLRRAGLQPDMAFDFDPDACDSYERNLGHRPVQMDVRDLLRMALRGWSPGPIDLLVADPPCTPWSRAGKRLGTEDERDMLQVTVDLVRVLRPRAYLIANVPGLDDVPNWPIVQRTIGGLARDGYCVLDFARLNAADYGVPQHRVRPFWFGHRDGPHICWPYPTHADPVVSAQETLPRLRALHSWVTCRDALAHLPPEDIGSPVRLRWRTGERAGKGPRASWLDKPAHAVTSKDSSGDGTFVFDGPNHRPSRPSRPSRTITRNTHCDGALLVNDKHPINRADSPSMTVTSKGDGRGAQGACVLEWPWDRPATTVTSRDHVGPPGHHEGSSLSQPNAIKLSERAAAILQGFREGWVFCGKTKRSRWSQIGQAMPPPLAEAVGRSIADHMRTAIAAGNA